MKQILYKVQTQRVIRMIIGIVLVILSSVLIFLSVCSLAFTEVIFNEEDCQLLFNCSTSEFFDKELDFYEETGDLRKYATVDKKGNIVLHLTKNKKQKLRESEWLISFKDLENTSFEISSDYSSLTLYLSPETNNEIENSTQKINKIIDLTMCKMYLIKSLDGMDIYDITIQYIERDSVTKEIIDSVECRGGHTIYYD